MKNKIVTYNGLMKTTLMVCCCFIFSCKDVGSTQNEGANSGLSKIKETSKSGNVSSVDDTLTINSKAISWAAVYRGELPCADCAGIQTEIKLRKNGRFITNMKYKGKDARTFNGEGKIIWEPGNIIELKTGNSWHQKYLVEKDQLVQLDFSGKRIKGNLAEDYILHKDYGRFIHE